MLINTLQNYWFSEKEARIYLTCLELWVAITSSIARHSGEKRTTAYALLKDLKLKWIAQELNKNGVKYYSVISPKQLFENEQRKLKKLEENMPELLAISNAFWNKAKVSFYDGFDRVKELFNEIIDEWNSMKEPFLSFVGTQNMDPKFEEFFDNVFIKYRVKQKATTRAIVADTNSKYSRYHIEKQDAIIVDDPIFNMWNEIVLWWNKVWILSYNTDEIYWLIIESKILSNGLRSMFNLIWKYNKI